MSYHDAKCPCGGRKEPQTMLCQPCVEHMKEEMPFELRRWLDLTADFSTRRSAAIRMLAAARRRNRLELPMSYRL